MLRSDATNLSTSMRAVAPTSSLAALVVVVVVVVVVIVVVVVTVVARFVADVCTSMTIEGAAAAAAGGVERAAPTKRATSCKRPTSARSAAGVGRACLLERFGQQRRECKLRPGRSIGRSVGRSIDRSVDAARLTSAEASPRAPVDCGCTCRK